MRLLSLSLAMLVAWFASMAAADAAEPPQANAPKADTDEWIATLDKAFAEPPEALKPPLVIFPMLDADDRVSADGVGLSYMATFAAVYTKRRHIDLSPPLTREVFRDAGCLKAKAALDKDTIRLCLAALGAKLYAIPKLVRQGDADMLTIACHGDGDKYRDKTFTHTMKPRDRRQAPGLIAQSVLEYLGVQLTPAERALVVAPQVRNEQDLRTLLAIDAGEMDLNQKAATLYELLARNPRCVAGWEIALISHATRVEAMRRFGKLQPPLECPRLHVSEAVQVRELGEPERALRMLLPYVASHHGDAYFLSTMLKCAMRLKDDRLTQHVLELWRKSEPDYAGGVLRGTALIDWAWAARGSDWANKVAPEAWQLFHERLQEAQREFKNALKINPSGWTAHARLINVCRGLGLPREVMEKHFHRAVELRPHYFYAYEVKFEYLKPRWHGSPEEIIEFGRECALTGRWAEGIPQIFAPALREGSTVPSDSGTICEVLQSPGVWNAILDYYQSASKGGDPLDRQLALNRLVRWGVYGGHFDDEVVVACQKLRQQKNINATIWPDFAELEFAYELVHAKTGRLMTCLSSPYKNDRALAKTGAALASGDFDGAAKTIEQIEPDDRLDANKAASYRAALAIGQKLVQDKHIDLQGAKGLEAFLGSRGLWKYGDDKFVCSLPANARVNLIFPAGIKHGVISGNVDWSDGISYAQIIAHTRAQRDRVILRYLPNHSVQLLRNNVRWQEAQHPVGPVAFRLAYGDRMDQLQPAAGIAWQAAVYDDVPSGFSFQIFTAARPATVTISGLRIERTD